MIGTQIEYHARIPTGTVVLSLIGIAGMGVSLATQQIEWAIATLPFWTIAFSLFLYREKDFQAVLTEEGLEFPNFADPVRYDEIESIDYLGKTSDDGSPIKQAAIFVVHQNGKLRIPAGINVASGDLFRFLWKKFTPRENNPLSASLEEYASAQAAIFGEDKVFRYTARRRLVSPTTRSGTKSVGIGMMLAGVLFFFGAGISEGFIGAGVIFLLLGFLVWLISLAKTQPASRQVKNWQASGLVVTPVGLALVQGPLKGRLRWDELRNIRLNQKSSGFHFSSASLLHGIRLEVEGSTIIVGDFYNVPQPLIYRQIRKYWQGQDE